MEAMPAGTTFYAGQRKTRREIRIRSHRYVVSGLAGKYGHGTVERDDLIGAGNIGLVRAADDFDPRKGAAFHTHAYWKARGEITSCLISCGHLIRQPETLYEARRKVRKAENKLKAGSGRKPTVQQIAAEAGIAQEDVLDVYRTERLFDPVSFGALDDDKNRVLGHNDGVHDIPDRQYIQDLLDGLKPLQRKVIGLVFYHGLEQKKVAERLNISLRYVSHLLRTGLQSLRSRIGYDMANDLSRGSGDGGMELFGIRYELSNADSEN